MMDFLPRDVVELVGTRLENHDLANLVLASKHACASTRDVLSRRHAERIETLRFRVDRAMRTLRRELTRSMMRQLDRVPSLEHGEFPEMDVEGSTLVLNLTSEWICRDDGYGNLYLRTRVDAFELNVCVSYGTTWTYDYRPERCWLGVNLTSAALYLASGKLLGTWKSAKTPSFRDDVEIPDQTAMIEDEHGNIMWTSPEDLVAPWPCIDLVPDNSDRDETFRAETRVVNDLLTARPRRVTVVDDVVSAWEASAVTVCDRYRSRANNPDWMHTGFAVDVPDWMTTSFPEDAVHEAFEAALSSRWTSSRWTVRRFNAGLDFFLEADASWKTGNVVIVVNPRLNLRLVRYQAGDDSCVAIMIPTSSGVWYETTGIEDDAARELKKTFQAAGFLVVTTADR